MTIDRRPMRRRQILITKEELYQVFRQLRTVDVSGAEVTASWTTKMLGA